MNLNAIALTWFGEADSGEQSRFLNQMAGALLLACRRDTQTEETQLCYIAEKLDVHGQRFVEQLADFVRLRREQGSVATPEGQSNG